MRGDSRTLRASSFDKSLIWSPSLLVFDVKQIFSPDFIDEEAGKEEEVRYDDLENSIESLLGTVSDCQSTRLRSSRSIEQ